MPPELSIACDIITRNRNKYIEEKLGKGKSEADNQQLDPLAALTAEEDALYALPEHLNPQVPAASKGAGDENGNGGVLIWSTGIAEVELPSAYKEKTVVATRSALERERVKAGRAAISSALPANFSTDFNRHRSDYVAELKSLNKGTFWMLLCFLMAVINWLVMNKCCDCDCILDEKRERGFRNGALCLLSNAASCCGEILT